MSASARSSSEKTLTVAVGSKNPTKIKAVKNGVTTALKITESDLEVSGYDVSSDVPDQPIGDTETKLGAKNRSTKAFEEHFKINGCYPQYSVGLEGGIAVIDGDMECFAWMSVFNGSTYGFSRTGSFVLPQSIMTLVNGGMELGHADDKVFGSTNAKQKGGTVGHLTKDVITRDTYYEHAIVLAFIPFLWPDLYDKNRI